MDAVAILVVAFFAGAIPFSNLVALRVKGVDLRDTPYGTVSGTSIYRVAGFWPLAVSGILDMAKGALGPVLAGSDWRLAAIAGGVSVAGHNWSPFLGGKGGRGIAPALGALAVTAWPGVPLLLGSLVVGKAVHQTGLGGFFGEVALVPVLAATHGKQGALAGCAVAVPMLIKRVLANARPVEPGVTPYVRRLLLDRDSHTPTP